MLRASRSHQLHHPSRPVVDTDALCAREKPRGHHRESDLSYLTRGFDWSANYTATIAADAKSMDLGAWVTLGNSNGDGVSVCQDPDCRGPHQSRNR